MIVIAPRSRAVVAPVRGGRGPKGDPGSAGEGYATVSALAAVAATDRDDAFLTEAGREGKFVFSSADLSAEVAADPTQTSYIAPASDPTGASGAWVRTIDGSNVGFTLIKHKIGAANTFARSAAELSAVKAFDSDGLSIMHWIPPSQDDALLNGTPTIDLASNIGEAFLYLTGQDRRKLNFPSGFTFTVNSPLSIAAGAPGSIIDAYGATITSSMTSALGLLNLAGDDITIRGLRLFLDTLSGNPWNVEVTGKRVTLADCILETAEGKGNFQMYVRQGADGLQMRGCRTKGSNGISVRASGFIAKGNHFIGRASGGDDAIALQAPGASWVVENTVVEGNVIENLVGALSIGSPIGPAGVNDPGRTSWVRGVACVGNVLKNCAGIARIKPGGVASVDYRDGTVEGVTISDNTLIDLNGAKLETALVINPGRGGIVRNIRGKNNVVIGRWNGVLGSSIAALQIHMQDMTGVSPGVNPPVVEDVDVEISFTDPYDGAAASGSNGSPFNQLAEFKFDNTAHGTVKDIRIGFSGSGSRFYGVQVFAGFNDQLTFRRLELRKINTDGSGTITGLHTESRIRVEDAKVDMLAGNPYGYAGSGEILSRVDHASYSESIPAGTLGIRYPWAAPRRAHVTKVELLNAAAISQSADDTNYTRFSVRNMGGTTNPYDSRHSGLTGGQAFPANTYNVISLASGLTGVNLGDSFYPKDALLYLSKEDFGTGNAVTAAYARVHWVPY